MFNSRQFDTMLFVSRYQPNKPLDFGCHMKIRTITTSTHTIFRMYQIWPRYFFFFNFKFTLGLRNHAARIMLFFFALYTFFLSFVLLPLSTLYIGNYAIQIIIFACIIPGLQFFFFCFWFLVLIAVENTFWVLIKIKTSILLHILWTLVFFFFL